MIPNEDVIKRIHDQHRGPHSKDGAYFIAHLYREGPQAGKFVESCIPVHAGLTAAQRHGADLFFTPNLFAFSSQKRSNETTLPSGVLFADLDGAPKPPIPPTILWETSPGNMQAVWFLDYPLSYERWADLNKRMTYYTGADKGGWMGSKLLRVPESVNWKRRAFGTLHYARHETSFDPVMLDKRLPRLDPQPVSEGEGRHPKPCQPRLRESLMVENWDNMSLLTRSMLSQPRVRDRSMHIWKTAKQLKKDAFDPGTIFQLIWVQPWCKWRTDRYDPDQLWSEILRA